jgi:Cdc6-like AAA superfamily ATPase
METLICKKTGGQIPPIEGIDYFLNRSIIVYGPTNSGKSVIITHILKQLREKIPNVIVICPTNNMNHVYTGLVPDQLIHSEVTPELIKNIVKKQEAGGEIYNTVYLNFVQQVMNDLNIIIL